MSANNLKVGVIFGGRSGEHEVSLISARSILNILDRDKYEIIQIGITQEGAWVVGENVLEALERNESAALEPAAMFPDPQREGVYIIRSQDNQQIFECFARLDVVFPVLHGTFGEDGTLQGMLELADVAYVGAGVTGSAIGMDKSIFKSIMKAEQIPCARSIVVLRRELENDMESVLTRATSLAPFPLFVKPANLGSSVGITKCRSHSDLVEGLMEAARFDRRILVEQGINAREIEVSVLGNDEPIASLPGEIRPKADFYTYEAKYLDDSSELLVPAPISAELTTQAQDYAIRAYKAVDCAGMARADFLLDRETEQLFINEINTIPGFTRISMYPKLWEASGLPYPQLLDRLIELALERKADRDRTVRKR